ncbi:glycosyltransferase family 4 protein [Hymenobacter aerilatus]|uniref:Glycosyltransferase family 4 protein n=1 Tax=Hymenobacter aerilatus TaxID=2932251 RepID=A0A8T9SP91_9BACT|nr:glycosyltransferase family 4 protein [Hymenobacter aerilatus]UOR03948.1 glycosyltransferase family 4 protein [Hymenobacter aerilatus]
MRIAYISFEYPPDTAVGGIATYVYQVSQMMKSRGHDVEVFCASFTRNVSEEFEGILVHRIVADVPGFPKKILPVFQARQQTQPFDLIESPEYSGDGYEIKKQFPRLPMVVKLHTPSYFIHELNNSYVPFKTKLKYVVGGIVRRQQRHPFWKWRKRSQDIDYLTAKLADQIHTPSISLGDIVAQAWDIDRRRILNVPYPFSANQKFLEIPITADHDNQTFMYLGRLEIRKGIVELVKAVPAIFQAVPNARFRIVGRTAQSTEPGLTMKEYVQRELRPYLDRIDFLEATPDQIPGILAQTAVCVFPSLWENFPNVCLEAMSAGRAIVGSREGGMYDMLHSPPAGLLVNPRRPKEIAHAVVRLLQNPQLRYDLGTAARQKVVAAYNSEVIGNLMEAHYAELAGR